MPELFADFQWRGLIHQLTDPALAALLDRGGLTAFIGFDPTADSLHVGSLLQLLNLRRLQQAGHRPIVLAGGATGMIGDPGGKSSERQLLDESTLRANVAGVDSQLRQFLDFSPGSNQAVLVNNYDWIEPLSVLQFLRDVGKNFTINQLITREAIRARLEDREQGISYTEFSYSLLQALDFWHLYKQYGCTLQLGASDQWGNIVAGVDLIRRRENAVAYGLCSPLVTKADGTKFGKTESGTVWLDSKRTSPYAFYQFFLRSEDAVVVQYLKFFTFLSRQRIEELDEATQERPRERTAQKTLAQEVTQLVHGKHEASRAAQASQALFGEEIAGLDESTLLQVFAEAPSIAVPRSSLEDVSLIDVLVQTGLASSKSNARQSIQQGGVSVNNRRVDDVEAKLTRSELLHDRFVLLRRGKREFAMVRFE